MIVIIKMRERNQKKFQAFLEKRLDERTREVVEQKDEIEEKNREITDSIKLCATNTSQYTTLSKVIRR